MMSTNVVTARIVRGGESAVRVNSRFFTTSVTVVVFVILRPVAMIVLLPTRRSSDLSVPTNSEVLLVGVMRLVGLKLQLAPVGQPLTVRSTKVPAGTVP